MTKTVMTPNPSALSAPLVSLRGLRFSYSAQAPVLCGVDMDIRRGEILAVLGRSGSGKSTLLKILAGLLAGGNSVQKSRGLKTSYIPQSLGLVRSQSALQNTLTGVLGRVGTWRSLAGFPAAVTGEAKELLARLGLEDKIHTPVARLSGGQRQRVAIARALMARPDLVLADEFVSQLDAVTAEDVLRLTRQVAERGTAVVMTAHHLDAAKDQADRVIVLKAGRVAWEVGAQGFDPEYAKELLA